jgi:hypothetical protein
MAGFPGNVGWIAAAKQTTKGTPVVISGTGPIGVKNNLTGGSLQPTRSVANLSETDSSRDRGVAYVQTDGVSGTPSLYARDASIPMYLRACLGSIASSGASNFTHTITPSNTLPYMTFFRDVNDVLWEQFADCFVSSLTFSAEAGAPLTCAVGVVGLGSTRLTAAPDTVVLAPDSSTAYTFNDATVTLGGSGTTLIRSFELEINNNVSPQQTDDVAPMDVAAGIREINLSFDLIFNSLNEYNSFHYGSTSGTALSPNIYTTSATFSFDHGVNNSIAFNLPSIAYEEFPVENNPGGDPIVVSVRAVGLRSGSPIVTATVKNQVAGTVFA